MSTTEELARREGFEPSIVGLEGRLPVHRSAHLERANGVEPSHASLAKMPRTMRARVLVPRDGLEPPYVANRATVLPLNERGIDWSEWQDSNLHGHAPKARGQPLTHTLNVGDSCWSLTSLKRFCRPLPGCSANESKWGGIRESNPLQRCHRARTIHSSYPNTDWCATWESNPEDLRSERSMFASFISGAKMCGSVHSGWG